jgi:Cd2+/Zn2+-exporting ATPase
MLSGDKQSIAEYTAKILNISKFYGDLLPENKVDVLEKIISGKGHEKNANSTKNTLCSSALSLRVLRETKQNIVAFVGDGINDTPVLALADVGIAMGCLGAQAAIEIADVVIQTDAPSRIFTAIKISKATHSIVIQNIVFALGIKFIVLLLGALGFASMWAAVFADVGVALIAILNSIRLFFKNFGL